MRYRFFLFLSALLFLIAALRLFRMQVQKGNYYRVLSEKNRIRVERLRPPRGRIYDFKGSTLAVNTPSFSVCIVREGLRRGKINSVLGRLASLFSVDRKLLEGKLKSYSYLPPFVPIPLIRDAGKDKVVFMEANSSLFPGVRVVPSLEREYPQGTATAHVVGYVGEASKEDISKGGYFPGDEVGKFGVEKSFENYLRGEDGSEEIEVNPLGRRIRVIKRVDPLRGCDVYLTIDLGVQRLMEELFEGKEGGAILVDPKTGRIYGLYSSPSFDPNWFSRGISLKKWKRLVGNPKKPLNNRVISCSYAPGSTFKLVVALCALSEGAVTRKTTFFCPGFLSFKGRRYRCWKDRGHGKMDIVRAIEESCDVFFYNLGLRLDVDTIGRYARALGYGSLTGIDLPGEIPGIIPSRAWKRKRFGERWYKGETLSLVIGQGYVSVTPIQQVVALSALINGGRVLKPMIVDRIVDPSGKVIFKERPAVRRKLKLNRFAVDTVKLGMLEVVEGDRGTGFRARIKGVEVAGKTGTAQVVKMKERIRNIKKIPYRFRDHAWFIAFAPYKDPRFVVAVVVEHGGHGGSAAAPIAKEILRYAIYNL